MGHLFEDFPSWQGADCTGSFFPLTHFPFCPCAILSECTWCGWGAKIFKKKDDMANKLMAIITYLIPVMSGVVGSVCVKVCLEASSLWIPVFFVWLCFLFVYLNI